MNILQNEILEYGGEKPIVYDVYFKTSIEPKPVIVFCHGYKGFKDWGAWHLVAKAFAEAGFFFLKFNFSHNGGTVQQPIDFPDLEAFAQNNYTKELNDLEQIIQFITVSKRFQQVANANNISLIGHSRGGGIVLIKAEENDRVKNVITWAGVSDYKVRFNEGSKAFQHWKETGRKYVENGRTKQQMPHDWQFYSNFIENEERLTIQRAVKRLSIPYLIIHGTNDTTVLVEEAKNLHNWNPNASLIIIEDGDHVFGAKHPWQENIMPQPLKKAVSETLQFLTTP